MRLFSKKSKRSFLYLNITQFLGAMNDNIFKLLIVYLLISIKGTSQASTILSIAGAIFVIPFLLFSSASGVLADRVRKSNIIVCMKTLELTLMSASLIAIYFRSEVGVYTFLFLMATQSTIFGPAKYGIIPEIVPTPKISNANGILSAFTCLAIIIGTFLASFITDITEKHFVIATNLCVCIAFLGLLASFKIKKTALGKSSKKINPLFIYEIYQTLKLSYKRKYLLPSIFGSGFFLFVGGFVQLNIIPFAIESLGLTDVGGGYLFLSTAIGIALGSWIAGKVSKDRVELGMSCLAGFVISFLLILLGFASKNLVFAIIIFILLGISGGMFSIPFDSFIQVKSPEARRGQIIAAANFMSFTGVLLASFCLYLISNILQLSAATGFVIIGLITFIFNFVNTGRLSGVFFPYITKKFLKHFYRIEIDTIPSKNSIIILNDFSWRQLLTLFFKIDNLKIITSGKKMKNFPLLSCFSDTIYMISEKKISLAKIKDTVSKIEDKDYTLCLLLRKPLPPSAIKRSFPERKNVYLMKTKKISKAKKFLGKKFIRTTFIITLKKV